MLASRILCKIEKREGEVQNGILRSLAKEKATLARLSTTTRTPWSVRFVISFHSVFHVFSFNPEKEKGKMVLKDLVSTMVIPILQLILGLLRCFFVCMSWDVIALAWKKIKATSMANI